MLLITALALAITVMELGSNPGLSLQSPNASSLYANHPSHLLLKAGNRNRPLDLAPENQASLEGAEPHTWELNVKHHILGCPKPCRGTCVPWVGVGVGVLSEVSLKGQERRKMVQVCIQSLFPGCGLLLPQAVFLTLP